MILKSDYIDFFTKFIFIYLVSWKINLYDLSFFPFFPWLLMWQLMTNWNLLTKFYLHTAYIVYITLYYIILY